MSGIVRSARKFVLCTVLLGLVLAVVAVGATALAPSAPRETPAAILSPFLSGSQQMTPSVLTSPNAQTDGDFGGAVAVSGSTIVVGAPFETAAGFTEAGHVYIFNTKTGDVTTLTSPNVQTNGFFGVSVAVSGSKVVIGASEESAGGVAEAGHAYLYDTKTGSLKVLSSPNPQAGGYFGTSVAISGSLILVSAPYESAAGMTEAGNVYVFSSATGDLISTLSSPNAQAGGQFGVSVAVSDSIAVVGAPSETDSGQIFCGNAYIFDLLSGSTTWITSPNSQKDALFGHSVGISGASVVVSAPDENVGSNVSAGQAYTFDAATGEPVATLTSPSPVTSGVFGTSVAINGSTVVVGAPQEPVGGVSRAGDSYTFSAVNGALVQGQFYSPNAATDGYYAFSVGISGSTVVVGAGFEDAGGLSEAGHAYYFSDLPLAFASPNAASYGGFGVSVAVGGSTAVIGARDENASGQFQAGNVYVLDLTTDAIQTLVSPNAQTGGEFGQSVAISGSTVVVGAPAESSAGQADAGNAYVFSTTTGDLLATLSSPSPSAGGYFGDSVAISGSTVVVGAPGETSAGKSSAGNAYVFSASTGTLLQTLVSPNAQVGGGFGTSVAISGSTIAVGAPGETDGGQLAAGNAYTFSATSGDLGHTLKTPNAQTDGEFGWSVSVSGATVAVGAPGETVGGDSYAGHAYTFNATSGHRLRTFLSPNAQTDGGFGTSVALGGTTLVVGADGESAGGQAAAGGVYTFQSHSGAPLDHFVSVSPQTSGSFGDSVAISGAKVLVGASTETSEGDSGAGLAYLF